MDPFSAEALIGVPVKPFPRWLRCVKCGLLSPFDARVVRAEREQFRPESTRFVHEGCRDLKTIRGHATPTLFQLDSFSPAARDIWMTFAWHWFVHGGPSALPGGAELLRERRIATNREPLGQVRRLRCSEEHGAGVRTGWSRTIYRAAAGGIRTSTVRRRLREDPRAILLGATNGWFPVTLSVLAIPQTGSPLAQLIADGWTFFEDVESLPRFRSS